MYQKVLQNIILSPKFGVVWMKRKAQKYFVDRLQIAVNYVSVK